MTATETPVRVRKPAVIFAGDGDDRHGTINGYVNLRCRCDECTEAITARKTGGLPDGDSRHGTVNGYVNYGCRCAGCTASWTADCDGRRIRRKVIANFGKE